MGINRLVKPFLKWAGGKRQLLPEIQKYVPKYNTYYEPFLGGGAVLFALQPSRAVVNDSNAELINCYQVIRDSVDELIQDLSSHNIEEIYYYEIREWDRNWQEYQRIPAIKRASRIIYLNKTCYNGLFRVNSQGQFNVPFGRYKNPNLFEDAVLKAVSKYLKKGIKILSQDFEEAVKEAKSGDFVYFDPPYDPVSNTASFTGYDINRFGKDEQRRLKKVCDGLTDRGCKIMLSNACTPFIQDLYRNGDHNYYIKTVLASRAINSNSSKRGKVDEVLVFNYDPEKLHES